MVAGSPNGRTSGDGGDPNGLAVRFSRSQAIATKALSLCPIIIAGSAAKVALRAVPGL